MNVTYVDCVRLCCLNIDEMGLSGDLKRFGNGEAVAEYSAY